jgi:hypothetical protein
MFAREELAAINGRRCVLFSSGRPPSLSPHLFPTVHLVINGLDLPIPFRGVFSKEIPGLPKIKPAVLFRFQFIFNTKIVRIIYRIAISSL